MQDLEVTVRCRTCSNTIHASATNNVALYDKLKQRLEAHHKVCPLMYLQYGADRHAIDLNHTDPKYGRLEWRLASDTHGFEHGGLSRVLSMFIAFLVLEAHNAYMAQFKEANQ